MDIFTFLKSVNKIAIAAFLITGFILLYEIYLFVKQKKNDKKAPKIPQLQKVSLVGIQKTLVSVKKTNKKNAILKPANHIVVIFLIILLLILGGIFATGSLWKNTPLTKPNNITPTPFYQLLTSEGIIIYNDLWQELTKDQLRYFKTGDKIFIAVKNIAGTDIVKARIRVNAKTWTSQDEVEALDQKFDVFYKNYEIASGDSQLRIEAQLYSKTDGWLGD